MKEQSHNRDPTETDPFGPSLECSARSEHIKLLVDHGIYVLLGNLAASITLVAGAWGQNPQQSLLLWLGLVLFFNGLRWRTGHKFPTRPLTEQEIRSWDRGIILFALASGILWGGAGILFFLPGEPAHNLFLAVLIIGLAAAAATTLSYHRAAYPLFFLPAVTPITIALMLEEGPGEQALASVTPFYFLLMYLLSQNIYKTAHTSTLLSLKNQRLAYYDHLTGVANRRAFEETLNREWLRAKRSNHFLSLIIADVDDFKHYNDTYGHAVGDKVLQSVAQMIDARIRRGADLAARIGGEEFAVILPETDLAGAQNLAEQIREHCHQIPLPAGISEPPHISIGVSACQPDDAQPVEALFQFADKAVYAAKQQGKDRVVLLQMP